MRDSIYRFTLDIHNLAPQVQIAAKVGDSLRQAQMTLTENGKPYYPAAGMRAIMTITPPGGKTLVSDCEIKSDGTVCYDFVADVTAEEGLCECELGVLDADGAALYSPRFTILVTATAFEDGARIAAREFADEMAGVQEAVTALKTAQEADETAQAEIKAALEALQENAPDVYVVNARYNFESDYIITVDKEPEDWVLDGSRRFVLRLTDGNRTLELPMLAGGESVYTRWMLAGIRPTGVISGMPYTIGGDTAQQPDYVYAPMGIDTEAHSSANCMYVKALGGGKWLWIAKPHVTASLSGIARDVFTPPSTLSGYSTSATYNTGDIVIHDSKVYRCKADSVTGTWDATKWDEQATIYTYYPADFTFLPLTAETADSGYNKNLSNLPQHTVTYINTSWFTGGLTDLASGYYYVVTTGVKSSNYWVQLAYGPVNGRLCMRQWVANASETGGGHYTAWSSLCDTALDRQGVPAESKAVGDAIASVLARIYNGRAAAANDPRVLTAYSGIGSDERLDGMPGWTITSLSGSDFLTKTAVDGAQTFPFANEIDPTKTYYIEKRSFGSTGKSNQYLLYRITRETIWSGYTSVTDSGTPQTINWSKLIAKTEAVSWVGGILSFDTPEVMTPADYAALVDPETGRLRSERYIDELPKYAVTALPGRCFLYLQPDFPDAHEIDRSTTYYLERKGSGVSPNVNFYTLYRAQRTDVWSGYTRSSDSAAHQTVYWNKTAASSADGRKPTYVAIGASTTLGSLHNFTTRGGINSVYDYPDYVGKALHLETRNLAQGDTGFLYRRTDAHQNFMDVIYDPANASAFAAAELVSIVFGYGNDGKCVNVDDTQSGLPVGEFNDYYPYDSEGYHPSGVAGVAQMLEKGATLFGCLNWCIRYLNTRYPKARLAIIFTAPSQNMGREVTESANPEYVGVRGKAPRKLTFTNPYDGSGALSDQRIWQIGQELPELRKALNIPIVDTYNDAGNAFTWYQTYAKKANGTYALFGTIGTQGQTSTYVWNSHPNDEGYLMYARHIAGLIVRQFLH